MQLLRTCPLCHEPVGLEPTRRRNLIVHRCPNCGLHFGENDSATAIVGAGSVETSPHHFSILLNQSGPLLAALADLIDRRWSYFTNQLGGQPRHWLEVGPGSGLLSSVVADRGGSWRGCEIDPSMATEMASRGLDVVHGDFAEMKSDELFTAAVAEQGGFDIVFLSQVLEHVRNPDRFLINAFAALRPGGMIYVDVPNNDGLTAIIRRLSKCGESYGEVVPPYHLIAYGSKTLRYALENAGFQAPQIITRSYNDATFGLAHARINPSAKLRLIWLASAFFSLGGNLVGMAGKPLSDV